jgi:hypothetical protein
MSEKAKGKLPEREYTTHKAIRQRDSAEEGSGYPYSPRKAELHNIYRLPVLNLGPNSTNANESLSTKAAASSRQPESSYAGYRTTVRLAHCFTNDHRLLKVEVRMGWCSWTRRKSRHSTHAKMLGRKLFSSMDYGGRRKGLGNILEIPNEIYGLPGSRSKTGLRMYELGYLGIIRISTYFVQGTSWASRILP